MRPLHLVKGAVTMKKKLFSAFLALMMVSMIPMSVSAKDDKKEATEETTEKADEKDAKKDEKKDDKEVSVELDYEAEPDAYVGKWVLTNAYTADDGVIDVEPDACTLEIELSIDENKLVDEPAYIHADATNLKGTISFNHDDIDVDDYSCSANWAGWTVVDVVGEGECYFKGAVKFKIRDDDEGMFFDVLTGKEIDDMELMDVIGMNEDGQIVIGYSEDHIERDGDAEWEYAYIFTKDAADAKDADAAETETEK